MLRNIPVKDDRLHQLMTHDNHAGIAVTNLGNCSPWSTIHTLKTSARRSLGPISGALISYF